MMPKIQAVPYNLDSSVLFAGIANWPWAVFLDSCKPASDQGRYDIITARPVATIVSSNGTTTLDRPEGRTTSRGNPFSIIKSALGPRRHADGLPFIGGAIGYAGYGVASYLPGLPHISIDDSGMPDLCFGIYEWALVVDHKKKSSKLIWFDENNISAEHRDELIEIFSSSVVKNNNEPCDVVGDVESNLSLEEYKSAFDKITRYIRDGDSYQVNFAQRFSAYCSGDPWHLYRKLRRVNPSPFAAYLNTPFGQVLSCSPERFLKVVDQKVETKPIKGTRARYKDPIADDLARKELEKSNKDKAENLMIVDLLRNDLGKCCKTGSIKVPELFSVESFATVHHLVSTVMGELDDGHDALDLLADCFPGGSITGAPKYRAMQIIEELEPVPRGVYCGSIGYISFNGNMDSNIAIRTMVNQNGRIHFSAGGGIVSDSEMESEYQETFHKARAMLDILI